jgi:hypothetical protein
MAILGRTASEGSVSGVLGVVPVVLILIVGVCAPLSGWLATRRSRKPVSWFVLGALTGPLALILLVAAPPGRCPDCDAVVDGWPTWCDACGRRLRDGAPAPIRPETRLTAASRPLGPRWPEPIDPVSQYRRPLTASIVERASIVTPPTSIVTPRPSVATPPRPIGTPPTPIGSPPTPIDSARSGLRREPRPVRVAPTTPTRRSVASTVRGSAPPAITASNLELATSTTDATGDVLSTGVYISGNAGLEIGACYAIARAGDQLRVFGPVDAGQLTIRQEGSIADFDVTAMDDRVIIAGREGRSSLAIVFRTIGGMRAAELESALAPSAVGFGTLR